MSKMDRQLNSKKDKEMIYEIYRACRLCGAGAGYKMPIIQNVVDMDDSDVELRQKVRECVQIEVHQDDKMPPLICELCVDKVNDFYEFLEMCRQTNKRTRLRLGLPPQSMPRGAPDAGDCILGLTEPVFVNDDSDGEPLSKQKKLNPKVKVKREPELKVRLENKVLIETRPSRFTKRPPTPPRITRHRTSSKDDNVSLSRLKEKPKSPKVPPKSILKRETRSEDNSLLTPRLKRSRDKEPVKLETPKKVKIQTKTPSQQTPKSPPKSSPRLATTPSVRTNTTVKPPPRTLPKRAVSPPRVYKCAVCGQSNKTSQGNMSHMKVHCVGFTSPRLACNPCGLWFASPEEASTHHRHHRNKSNPYTCRRCEADFIHLSAYDEHFDNNTCVPFEEVPDVKCDVCWHLFATNNLLDEHKCLGEDHRPGGKCGKCKKSYALLRNLKRHEQSCTAKKKGELVIDPVLLGKVKPIQIRMSRCDPLLSNHRQEHYDVSNVTEDFGLDKNCVYPYISSVSRLRIKSDPDELDRMVDIKDEIKNEFYIEEDYVHWDSEDSESDEITCSTVLNPKKKVDTLANLTLKTLFSKKCLGKVPKRKRRVKQEKSMFDSLLGETEDDVTRDINNIIDNLGDDDDLDGENQKAGDVSQKGGDESQKSGGESQKADEEDKSMDVSDDKGGDVDGGKKNDSVVDKDTDVDKEAIKEKNTEDSSEENDQKAQNDKLSNVIDGSNDKKENNATCDDEVSKQEEKDINGASKNFNSVCNVTEGSNNNLSNSNNNDDLSQKDNVNNSLNSFSFDYDDGTVINKNKSESNVNDNTSDSTDENQKDGSEAKNDEINFKMDFENNQDSNSVGAGSESLLNDTDEAENKEPIDDNATSLAEQNTDVDENKSQITEFSIDNSSQESSDLKMNENNQKNKDLSQESTASELKMNDNNQKKEDLSQESTASELKMNDSNQTNEDVDENDYTNAISVIVNSGKSKVSTESEELEDSRLMAALDAQIGDGNENSREQVNDNPRVEINDNSRVQLNDNFNDKIALDDLISAKSDDMGMIPEDFNFDA